ncbi:MAG: T9SS type A sorting domain-containing protein [Bacteroidales bacterium]|nr:T9SS type A sorting domain-containing protein [Bacteroidales bacterium]
MKKSTMKKFKLIGMLLALLVFGGYSYAQMPDAITIEPANATANDTIMLWLNTNQTCPEGDLDTATNIHIHSGANIDGAEWQNVVDFDSTDAQGNFITQLTQENDSMWYIEMVPAEFYSVPDTSTMTEIDAVFNNGSWDAEGKDFDEEGNCTDFYIPLSYNVEVTLNVDISTFADTTDFDPEMNSVYLSGSFFDPVWPAPGSNPDAMMTDEDEDMVYTWTGSVLANVEYEYKHFYVPDSLDESWSYGEWQGETNRSVTFTGPDTLMANWGTFMLEFWVTSDGSTALEGAEITIGDMVKTSDAEGYAYFDIAPDTDVEYTITHPDYPDKTGTVSMGYEDMELTIDMSSEGIGDNQASAFNVYPNPVDNVLYIDEIKDVNKIEIYNVVGQQVKTIDNISNGTISINTSDLKEGVYFITLVNEAGQASTAKFIKE